MKKNTEKILAYIFGVTFLIALIVLAICFPEPKKFQYEVFRIVLSIAVAGVAAMIPGFIEVNISNLIKAGGALAIFVIVYFYSPASLVSTPPDWISISFPPGTSFRTAVNEIAENDSQTAVFTNCSEALLSAKVRSGRFMAETHIALTEALKYRFVDSSKDFKYHVKHLKKGGIYEIICE